LLILKAGTRSGALYQLQICRNSSCSWCNHLRRYSCSLQSGALLSGAAMGIFFPYGLFSPFAAKKYHDFEILQTKV
jgi:hypothetical protein